jgi:mannose-6-phosphate isomerase-like protein (cupin superfamily)
MTEDDYIDPPNHFGFRAKALLRKEQGTKVDGAIAIIDPKGGGPSPDHTHEHDHLFFVIKGTATIRMGFEEVTLNEDKALVVLGNVEHSVWKFADTELKMIGINLSR